MPQPLQLQQQLGFQPKEYLSFAAPSRGTGGDLTSHFRVAAEHQHHSRLVSQGGEGTVATHNPYTAATAVSLGHSPFSQAIAARPLLSQASVFPHSQNTHVLSNPMTDAHLHQQHHQCLLSMYAAAQAATVAHSPASTATLMLTPNLLQPFTPSASATTVVSAASAAVAAAAAHFRLPASVFDTEGVGAPLQIDLLSYQLGLKHAAKAAEQKRQALRAANAGSKRKNGTADAAPSPIVASADASAKTAPKRAKLPAFTPLLPAAALSGGGFQAQLMQALSESDQSEQQQLHQLFSLHASETNLSMSRESTAATAATATTVPMNGGVDGYGGGEMSVHAASMMRAHLAGHSHFSSPHSSPMPPLHLRGATHKTAGRSGVATQEGTSGSSTASSARVFQPHQSREGETAKHGLPNCPSPGSRAQQQRDGWASAPDTPPHLGQQHQLVFSLQIVPKQTVTALQLEGVVDGDRERDAADADIGSPVVETSFAEGHQSQAAHAKLSFDPASKLDLMCGGGGAAEEEGNVIVAHSGGDSLMRTPRLNHFVADGDLRPLFSPGELPGAVHSSAGMTGCRIWRRDSALWRPCAAVSPVVPASRSLCILGEGKANSSRPDFSLGGMMQRITQQQQQQQRRAPQATAPTQQPHSPMHIQASVQPPPDDLLSCLEAQRADLICQLEVQQRMLRAQNAVAQATQQEDPTLLQLQLETKELARQRSYLFSCTDNRSNRQQR